VTGTRPVAAAVRASARRPLTRRRERGSTILQGSCPVACRLVASRRFASELFATAAARRCSSGAALRQRVDLWRAAASTCQRGDAAAWLLRSHWQAALVGAPCKQGRKQHRSNSCCTSNSCCCCCCCCPFARWRSACHQSACRRSACRQLTCRLSTVRDGSSSALLVWSCAASARRPQAR
jgi:hypothetical protein